MTNINITPKALLAAKSVGVYGRIEARLARMVRLSAPTNSPYGNRRFDAFILNVNDGKLVDVVRLN